MKTPGPEFLFSEAEASNFIKNETLAQVFSCEFWEISKNTFLQNSSERLLQYLDNILGLNFWMLFQSLNIKDTFTANLCKATLRNFN